MKDEIDIKGYGYEAVYECQMCQFTKGKPRKVRIRAESQGVLGIVWCPWCGDPMQLDQDESGWLE